MAVEWTITIEGKSEFGDVCRREVRVDKSWERLFDGEIGLSIEDGKKIMTALQSAVVNCRRRSKPADKRRQDLKRWKSKGGRPRALQLAL
ncbi:hypothetical protein ACFSQQ_39985 [Mesorhizobium kowhaii]|uniref:hypothetical protein n=1 Tax=Mesorhizobium kowhaii TaxID=1300272 RepID=UPI0035EED5E6